MYFKILKDNSCSLDRNPELLLKYIPSEEEGYPCVELFGVKDDEFYSEKIIFDTKTSALSFIFDYSEDSAYTWWELQLKGEKQ